MTELVHLTLHPRAYRILFAMGGVQVLAAERESSNRMRATLRMSGDMLAFARRLDGVEAIEPGLPPARLAPRPGAGASAPPRAPHRDETGR